MNTSQEIILGQRIEVLRKKRHMSIEVLSSKAGIDYSYLCKILNGKVNCSLKKLVALADALEVEVKGLFDFEEEDITREKRIEAMFDIINEFDDNELRSLYSIVTEIRRLQQNR